MGGRKRFHNMPAIGLVANVYNEINALPGWLETHLPIFDDVRILHAGPQGAYSTDGTLELLESHGVPVEFCAIDEGFGAVRTRAIRMSPCEWVMLLDADERFFPMQRILTCEGENTPPLVIDSLLYDYGNPNYEKDGPRDSLVLQSYDTSIDFSCCPSNFENMRLLGSKLSLRTGDTYDAMQVLRSLLHPSFDAVRTMRRHWHDLTMQRPTQNWHIEPDYQTRILRNNGRTGWDPSSRMHEQVVGVESYYYPNHTYGPFFDHFHLYFKKMEVQQRIHDIAIYNAINEGKVPPIER